jgi:hypothetical protein
MQLAPPTTNVLGDERCSTNHGLMPGVAAEPLEASHTARDACLTLPPTNSLQQLLPAMLPVVPHCTTPPSRHLIVPWSTCSAHLPPALTCHSLLGWALCAPR